MTVWGTSGVMKAERYPLYGKEAIPMKQNDIDPIITEMVEDVVGICSPLQIFLVSRKNGSDGELKGFKLCIVAGDGSDPHALESKLSLETDCVVPCDFIVYTAAEWIELVEDDCSFAYRVDNMGVLLYGER